MFEDGGSGSCEVEGEGGDGGQVEVRGELRLGGLFVLGERRGEEGVSFGIRSTDSRRSRR